MVKIKVFEMKSENSQVMSDFLNGVNVMQNGILLSENNIGIMYQDKDDVGMDVSGAISALNAELVKSQKQFVVSDNLANAYEGLIVKCERENIKTQEAVDLIEIKIATQNSIYFEKESVVKEAERVTNHIKAAHKKANRVEKDELLKQYHEADKDLNAKYEAFALFRKENEAVMAELNAELGPLKVDIANNTGEIKFLKSALYDRDVQNGAPAGVIKAREDARMFIKTTMEKIEELKSNGLSFNTFKVPVQHDPEERVFLPEDK